MSKSRVDQQKEKVRNAVNKLNQSSVPQSVTYSTISTSGTNVSGTAGMPMQTGHLSTAGSTVYQSPPASPHYQFWTQQYPAQYIPFPEPPMSEEDREHAIEFIEEVMFLIAAQLDECDVPNRGGTMDRNPGMPLRATIDLGEYEITINKK